MKELNTLIEEIELINKTTISSVEIYDRLRDVRVAIIKQFIIPDVVKSFTAEEVINVLDSSYELIDAKSFFEDCKK